VEQQATSSDGRKLLTPAGERSSIAVETRDLSKIYISRSIRRASWPGSWSRGRSLQVALRGVDLQVMDGDVLGVVGESGSGKSTLARLLLALERPTSGEVYFRGQRVDDRSERERRAMRREMQIVFQDPMGSLDPRMSVRDIIEEPLRSLSVPGDHGKRVAELLDAVGLPPDVGRNYPHQFSGGQRQRIAIARALAPSPSVLVADEAVSALDVSVRAQILNLLADLIERFSLTMIFISHDMGVVRYLCNRIVVLYQGCIVESGSAGEVFSGPAHPYTRSLLEAVPRLGVPLSPSEPLPAASTVAPGPGQEGGCPYAARCPHVFERCLVEAPRPRLLPGSPDHGVSCHKPLTTTSGG